MSYINLTFLFAFSLTVLHPAVAQDVHYVAPEASGTAMSLANRVSDIDLDSNASLDARSTDIEINIPESSRRRSDESASNSLSSPTPGNELRSPERLDVKTSKPPQFAPNLDTTAIARKMVAGLVLVISVFTAIAFLVPKLMKTQRKTVGTRSEMELLDTIFVAPRCCVHLISVQDQLVLVGRDATGMKEIVPIRSAFDASLTEAVADDSEVDETDIQRLANQAETQGATRWTQ